MVKISTNIMNFLKNLFYTKDEVNTQLSNKANTSHSHSDDDVSVTTANYGEGINQNTFNGYLSYDMLTVKDKLNGIEDGANKTTVDSSLSSSSTNPVQNKVIQTALDEKANTEHTHNDYEGIKTLSKEWIKLDCTTQLEINRKLWQIYDKVITMDDYANNYKLPTASADILGGVKVGTNLSIDDNGILSATDTTYGTATTSANGLMSSSDKTKLNGIATNANNYSLPTASADILGGVKVGNNLRINNEGVLSAANTTYGTATTSANGLMSSSDKSKLDGIATGANKITVDSSLSSSSTNPVQNKVINSALSGKADSSHTHDYNSAPSISCYLSDNPIEEGTSITTKSITRLGVFDNIKIPYKNSTREGYKTEDFQMESFILQCCWRPNTLGSNSSCSFVLYNPLSGQSEMIEITPTPRQTRTWVQINDGSSTIRKYDSYNSNYGTDITVNNFIFMKVTTTELSYKISAGNTVISSGSQERSTTTNPNNWCFKAIAGAWSSGTDMDFVISPIQIIPLY